MALLNSQLSVWEIAFRWGGYDPDKSYIKTPLIVKDNFRLIVDQIFASHLDCETLSMNKYKGDDPLEAKYYIRYWLDPIKECIEGKSYSKDLFKFARIDRWEFLEWCTRHKVPLPEFWFPSGWGHGYEWPDYISDNEEPALEGESFNQRAVRIDERHRIEMACKQFAITLWLKEPSKNIKDIANTKEIQNLAGGENYEFETVLGWLGQIDPRDPSKKRGRKRKNNSGSNGSENL